MTTEITYRHFCNLGALNNKNCFTRWDKRINNFRYYYLGKLSEASWAGAGINPLPTEPFIVA